MRLWKIASGARLPRLISRHDGCDGHTWRRGDERGVKDGPRQPIAHDAYTPRRFALSLTRVARPRAGSRSCGQLAQSGRVPPACEGVYQDGDEEHHTLNHILDRRGLPNKVQSIFEAADDQ